MAHLVIGMAFVGLFLGLGIAVQAMVQAHWQPIVAALAGKPQPRALAESRIRVTLRPLGTVRPPRAAAV